MGKILAHNKVSGYFQLSGSTPENNAAQSHVENAHYFDKPELVEIGLTFQTITSPIEVSLQSDNQVFTIDDATTGDTRSVRFANPSNYIGVIVRTKGGGIEEIGSYTFDIMYNISAVHSWN